MTPLRPPCICRPGPSTRPASGPARELATVLADVKAAGWFANARRRGAEIAGRQFDLARAWWPTKRHGDRAAGRPSGGATERRGDRAAGRPSGVADGRVGQAA